DGIRDFHVTGVQTCALPISMSNTGSCRGGRPCATRGGAWKGRLFDARQAGAAEQVSLAEIDSQIEQFEQIAFGLDLLDDQVHAEIGRASCRERAQSLVLSDT